MIKIEREPGEAPGIERCCFCRKQTHFWYLPKDVAVCEECAKRAQPKDVPDKETWCRREEIATHLICR